MVPQQQQQQQPREEKKLAPHEKEMKEFGLGMFSSLDNISGFGSTNNVRGISQDQFNIGLCGNVLPIDNSLAD
jgi:hypothetical protein